MKLFESKKLRQLSESITPPTKQKTSLSKLETFCEARSYYNKLSAVKGDEIKDLNGKDFEELGKDFEEICDASDSDGDYAIFVFKHTPSGMFAVHFADDDETFWVK